ncbi:hypothetical protein CcaverHIS002_0212000 [Cutaneotrichosporon cavernicola]|uniref:Integrase catalytic domain-containing protein n=1 Tax=Cutaneotrichosporon cavernicola TaxID=279322 RepID=A0AA48L1L3_9TREE|nr:uncharacterized protein CcaverHIS019_0212020 [Cutaneotrichosporon cavernicola]BEI82040.1 hypothetical protein CcaverHIS002_0212000 [Cutaneotrichosporon cavernicola]BEI89840.1 hypothetical protein CcaverHIS019_0212020 [Cutaneotrichosporon cavernicola]BEI97610.1 hypothetical protein CcaverHIS631_0211990 [Cutaneotrichosporon cavernicola]BEJ05389.1 hypothetical protein CcaverHIS641_0212060 [Cutaneotrichosporon cavernicola]
MESSTSDLHQYLKLIPKLTGIENYSRWHHAFNNWLNMLGGTLVRTQPEPYRVPFEDAEFLHISRDVIHPPDQRAGDAPPTGLAIAINTAREASNIKANLQGGEITKWEKWARKQRVARTTVMATIDYTIARDVDHLWSLDDVLNHLAKLYNPDTPLRLRNLNAKITTTFLTSATADNMRKHVLDFTAVLHELADIGHPVSEPSKCLNFLESLTRVHLLYSHMRTELALVPTHEREEWAVVCRVYEMYIATHALRTPSLDSTTAPTSSLAASNPHQPKQWIRNKPDPTKYCDYHKRPGHATVDCTDKAAGRDPDRKRGKKDADHKPPHLASAASAPSPAPATPLPDLSLSYPMDLVDDHYINLGALAIASSTPAPTSPTTKLYIDSGAGGHLISNPAFLSDAKPCSVKFYLSSSRYYLMARYVGVIRLGGIPIQPVYFTDGSTDSFLSEPRLVAAGWDVDLKALTLSREGVVVTLTCDNVDGRPIVNATSINRLAASSELLPSSLTSTSTPHPSGPTNPTAGTTGHTLPPEEPLPSRALLLLHTRLGHIGKPQLVELARHGLLGDDWTASKIDADPFNICKCKACLETKTTKNPSPGTSPRGTASGDYMHVDLKGPFITSRRGMCHWLLIYTDHTAVRLAIPIHAKTEAHGLIQTWIRRIERQTNIPIAVVRSDGAGDFGKDMAREFYNSLGILHEVTAPYDPARNGVAERGNRTMSEMLRAMFSTSGLPPDLWCYGIEYASFIANSTRINSDGRTPWQTITHRVPKLLSLPAFGQVVYAHIHEAYKDPLVKVLDPAPRAPRTTPATPRAFRARILGADMATLGWIVLIEQTNKIITVRDVRLALAAGLGDPLPPFDGPPDLQKLAKPVKPTTHDPAVAALAFLDKDSDVQKAIRAMDAVDDPFIQLAASTVNTILESSPITYRQAIKAPDAEHWQAAMAAETEQLFATGTMVFSNLPSGRRAIPTKWVFKPKRDATNVLIKRKARLCVRGDVMTSDDYDRTFAPTARLTSVRALVIHAIKNNMVLHQADVEGAFLNGTLEEEVYIKPPPGLTLPEGYDCLRLHKALYGLKQAPRVWWQTVVAVLADKGFYSTPSDIGLFHRSPAEGVTGAWLALYVDDFLSATLSHSEALDILDSLRAHWAITDLGEPKQLLGMSLQIHADKVDISQTNYIEQMAERFQVDTRRSGKAAPLPTTATQLPPSPPAPPPLHAEYREMVGSILWVARCTRPDVAFAAGFLGRFAHAPSGEHIELAKRVIAHLLFTKDYVLRLAPDDDAPDLEAYSDADHAGDRLTRRSTTGHIHFLYGCPVSWTSRRQATLSNSTMEAEYVAAASCVRETIWLRYLLTDLLHPPTSPTTLYIDNLAAIRLSQDDSHHEKAKHIDIANHVVRERVNNGTIICKPVTSANQLADILTKPLPGTTHNKASALLHVVKP